MFNISHRFYNVNPTRAGNVPLLIIAVSSFIYSKYIHGIFAVCPEFCTWYALVKIVWEKDIWVERKEFSLTHTVRVLLLFWTASCFVLTALGPHCSAQAFSSCSERGLLFVAGLRLLTAVTSLVMAHGLQAHGLRDMQALERGLSCCGTQA